MLRIFLSCRSHLKILYHRINRNFCFGKFPSEPLRIKQIMDNTVLKSPNDKLEYRVIELRNGLKALLISDLTNYEENDDNENLDFHDKTCKTTDNCSLSSSDNSSEEMEEESDDDECDDKNDSEDDQENEMEPDNIEDCDEDEEEDDEETESISDDILKKRESKQGEKLSAAGLCVGVGSFSDPESIPGLAHFLEHMVFMGCEKYPDENSFDSFIYKHGGSDNASTDCERTVFHFEVHSKYFQESLERFAQFFIHPLMKQDSMDREMKAVDSEFRLSLPSDTYRKQQLRGSFAKKGHPMGKYMWGCISTLKNKPMQDKINVHAELKEFWKRYYSAHYMTLAVQSRESLDTLENWVRQYFSEIPNNGLPRPDFQEQNEPFEKSKFCRLYKVIPVKNCLQLELHWSLPSLMHEYRKKPLHYISSLIGHEGKGSILSYLRRKVWALGLYSGNDESGFEHNSTYSDFTILVELTEEGFTNVSEVITVIMQYIDMLKRVGPQERLYKEFQTVEANDFRWKEEVEAAAYVEELCENMQIYQPEDYIAGDQLMYEYDRKLIEKCQNLLSPDTCNILIFSQTYEKENICTKTEEWYQTKYMDFDIPEEWLQKWKNLEANDELFLPDVNKFIATNFEIKLVDEPIENIPIKLLEDKRSRLWYKKDNKFNIPKAYMYFRFKSPVMNCSLESIVLLDLFVNILAHNLKEEVYPATVAQLSYSIHADDLGLIITVHGFNHKLPILFETILDYIKDFTVTDELFDAIKNYLRKAYYNNFIKPSNLCKGLVLSVMYQVKWLSVDKRKIVSTFSKDKLLKFVEDFRSNIFTEGLIQGNMSSNEAKEMVSLIYNKFNSSEVSLDKLPQIRIMQMPKGTTYCRVSSFNKEDGNSVVTNFYQSGSADIRKTCLMDLLMMIMEEPCFDVLRTREQLGYIVNCTWRCLCGILGFTVTIHTQADKFSCFQVDERIEAFLENFKQKLINLSDKDFQTQVVSLIKLKQCVDLHLKEEVDRNWSEIVSENYVFDRLQKEVVHLKNLTLPELQEWYMQHILSGDGSRFRKLGVHVVGQTHTHEVSASSKKSFKKCDVMLDMNSLSDQQNESIDCDDFDSETIVTDDDDDDKHYHLEFLPSNTKTNSELFILNIEEFKKGLTVYPVSKIIN